MASRDVLDAARAGDARNMERILARIGDDAGILNIRDDSGYAALHWVQETSPECVRLLLRARADPDDKDSSGWTPLHWAVEGHTESVEALLEGGANPNVVDGAGKTALHYAAAGGYPASVRALVAAGAHLDLRDHQGQTALYYATSDDVTETLLRAGADPETRGALEGHLLDAVMQGDVANLEIFLARIGDDTSGLNKHDDSGFTLVHWALDTSVECLRLLLRARADPDAKDGSGWTPLHWAVEGYTESVEALLEGGANPNVVDGVGKTALHYAAAGYPESVRLLVEAGADLSVTDGTGSTAMDLARAAGCAASVEYLSSGTGPLVKAARGEIKRKQLTGASVGKTRKMTGIKRSHDDSETPEPSRAEETGAYDAPETRHLPGIELRILEAAQQGDAKEMERILARVGDDTRALNGHDDAGFAPLHYALATSPECVRLLLRARADPDDKDGAGWTSLHWAVEGYTESVQALLEGGANPNVDRSGETALHYAAAKYPESVRLLVEAGADLSLINGTGSTAMDLAKAAGCAASVEYLSSGTGPLVKAARGDGLAAPKPKHLPGKTGVANLRLRTELLAVAIKGHVGNMQRILADIGDDTSVLNSHDDSGFGPLHWVQETSPECVRLLLRARADPDDKDSSGWTPLHWAVEGHTESVEALLEGGANPNVVDRVGKTALHYAVTGGFPESVRLLVEAGADLSVTDGTGSTAMDLAKAAGCAASVEYLSSGTGPLVKAARSS